MSITIVELAKLAGCSDASVSLVLNGKAKGRISSTLQDQILALAKKHGYQINPVARALVKGRTARIAVCLDGHLAEHAIIGELSLYVRLSLVCRGIQEAGYSVEIVEADLLMPLEKLSRQFCRMAVDGFIFLHWSPQRVENLLFSLKEKGIPAVASGTTLPSRDYTWTDIEVYETFHHAAARLIHEGHPKVIFLDTIVDAYMDDFRRGFIAAVSVYLNQGGNHRLYRPQEISLRGIRMLMERVSVEEQEVTAFILSDNFYAEAVLDCLAQRGVQPGKDCRVIGFGDTILAERCRPRLSHYGLRIEEQVAFGLKALVEAIEHPKRFKPRQCKLPLHYIPGDT